MTITCRPRPRKVTNSEKTSTTNNLSQHKYLKLKRQTQQDTDNKFITTRDTDIQNQSVRSMTAPDIGQKGVPAASYNLQHQYKLVSGWESQWHALYHHFTSYHQQRYLSSYHNSKTATSHLKSSDLPKLLTSTRLSPQVTANQQNFTLCNSQHHPQSSSTDEENPLCHDQSLDIAPDNYDSCTLQGLPMTCTESLLVSTINMPSNGRAASNSTATADPIRTSWYNEYLRATLQRMHVRTLKERKKTRSAPGGSVSTLTKDSKQRPELFSSTITYFSQRYQDYLNVRLIS